MSLSTDILRHRAEATSQPARDDMSATPTRRRVPRRGTLAVATAVVLAVGFLGGWLVAERVHGFPELESVDVGFLRDMSDHHDQAVQLALVELANGESEVPKGFALDVVASQRYEIGLMEARLRDWGHGRGDLPREATTWMGHAVPMDQMPGMASSEQIAEFAAAHGTEADAMFIRLMTEHHRGGLQMAEYAWRHAQVEEVRDLAERIATLQRIEIRDLQLARERLGLRS